MNPLIDRDGFVAVEIPLSGSRWSPYWDDLFETSLNDSNYKRL